MLCISILFVIHEWGHYIAFKALGIDAVLRKSVFAPGIDPKKTTVVSRGQGIFIAMNGFVVSSLLVLLPLLILGYSNWPALAIGGIAGSVVDIIWALSMLRSKTVTLYAR